MNNNNNNNKRQAKISALKTKIAKTKDRKPGFYHSTTFHNIERMTKDCVDSLEKSMHDGIVKYVLEKLNNSLNEFQNRMSEEALTSKIKKNFSRF
ncbi:9515_t:CDS:2 [Entrophospora sp. SA101]|nr:9509_t:CDS:2 [Entrophospora sp. SA101]CAJ0873329.1 9511_t:CDS:2 [Entrophospora sp. SA101]CAJ0873373.1 9515_t:CDS:2 [Entrophospora sp. SA101]